MSERRRIIMAELYWMMDELLEQCLPAIAESEERAEEVTVDIKEALNLYFEALSQLSEAELIKLHCERLLRYKNRMGQIESVS